MKKILFFLFSVVCCISIAYLHFSYPEQRWISKTVLDLPKLTYSSSKTNYQNYPTPQAQLVNKDEQNEISVIFDTEPLNDLTLNVPWEEQKNAAKQYGKKINILPNKHTVSVILTDVGINDKDFQKALKKLPPCVLLSFSPYALDLKKKIQAARSKGFENTFDLPVNMPNSFFEGGANAINSNMSASEIYQLLNRYYDLEIPFIGFVAPSIQNKKFSKIILNDIDKKGLIFIDLDTAKKPEENLFYSEALKSFLQQAIETKDKQTIIALPMTSLTIDVVANWIGATDFPDIQFIPVSAYQN